jgi:beta-xylosidase
MVYNGDHPEIRQTGHMDIVEGTEGRWWAVFLAVRPVWEGPAGEKDVGPRLSQLGRETFLAPIYWQNDWPIINNRRAITINGSTDRAILDVPRSPQVFEDASDFAPGMSEHQAFQLSTRNPGRRTLMTCSVL